MKIVIKYIKESLSNISGLFNKNTAFISIAIGVLIAIVALFSCQGDYDDYYVTFSKDNKTHRFELEVANTQETRAQGLMNREELGRNEGMVFLWNTLRERTFWMKNTKIPLDMIFLNGENILGSFEKARPLDETRLSIPKPADIIIEINGGLLSKYGINNTWNVIYSNDVIRQIGKAE